MLRHKRRLWIIVAGVLALGIGLAAVYFILFYDPFCCADPDRPERTEKPTPTPPNLTPTVDLSPEQRTRLEDQYETLRQTQTQIEAIWSDLQAGRAVQCSPETPRLIPPDAITGDDPVALVLREAAVALDTALNLWIAECRNPRAQPPPDVIDRGLRAALAAGDALREAAQALSQ